MFHVELRQRPHTTRAFNLTAEELGRRFLAPLRAGQAIAYAEREWEPARTRLTIYEGRVLGAEEIGLGRGWQTVMRTGTEVTERVLSAAPAAHGERPVAVDQLKERVLGRLTAGPQTLTEVVEMADALLPGARPSQRLSAAELAVWELLHERAIELEGAPRPEAWEARLLGWEAWRQATVSSIRLARSASEANR
ncbi:MAG TPA: hypothetical protein VFP55_14190 [Solirubrobacteraceae bacterium]|nr:hypothetical protein [Solirubrobacteraceae bacterium]